MNEDQTLRDVYKRQVSTLISIYMYAFARYRVQ